MLAFCFQFFPIYLVGDGELRGDGTGRMEKFPIGRKEAFTIVIDGGGKVLQIAGVGNGVSVKVAFLRVFK